jgi:hypothetical protein
VPPFNLLHVSRPMQSLIYSRLIHKVAIRLFSTSATRKGINSGLRRFLLVSLTEQG